MDEVGDRRTSTNVDREQTELDLVETESRGRSTISRSDHFSEGHSSRLSQRTNAVGNQRDLRVPNVALVNTEDVGEDLSLME